MYWDPFDELERMHEEMDRMFRRMWGGYNKPMLEHKGTGKGKLVKASGFRAPICHMHETENNVIAAFELPGVNKADIDLRVEDDHLVLKVEAKDEKKEKKEGAEFYSSYSKSFYRTVPLPVEVDSEKANAEYKDGVLRVEMPKKHKGKKKGKKVDVK